MPTPSIQILRTDAQQVLNLDSISAVRSVVAASLANANAGTPLNPNLTTQQLWNEFYQIVTQPKSDIESIIANQLMKFLYAPPAPGGVGADKQVIFNDGGVLAGDPGLTFDKVTNALTITGDLTVATDRLKVVTGSTAVQIGSTTQTQFGTTDWPTSYIGKSGSRVLIGSAGELILWNEAAAAIGNNSTLFVGAKSGPVATIIAGGAIKGGIENTSDYSGFLTLSTQRSDASMIERYRIDSTGIATWSNVGGVAGTAMTLNSGGLAIGTTTNYGKLSVAGSIASFASATIGAVSANSGYVVYSAYAGAGAYISLQPTNSAGTQFEAARIDTNGNLILSSSTVPATLASNYQLTLNATSNTNLRFSYRGSDGVTRVANLTLA